MRYLDFPLLPGGIYRLRDGREFRALSDLELVTFACESSRCQYQADLLLARRLELSRPRSPRAPVPAKPALLREQLAWAI